MPSVTYDDVVEALPRVRAELNPTALLEWPGLSELLGCRLYLKHENHQPTGAFKVRGGINLVGSLSESEREVGILGCSTGNHGQSLAFAARRFGVRCTIIVPQGNNPDKNRAIRLFGAELIERGRDFDEARDYLEKVVAPRGGRYVHSANEPQLIAGVGSMSVEIFDALPAPDVIFVPIGLGSGVCGTGIVARARGPRTKVIGVQAEGADAVSQSWRTGEWRETAEAATWAEGVATRRPAALTLELMRSVVDDVVLVTDNELRRACRLILEQTHNIAEGAGAAAMAAAFKTRERWAGQTVVCIISGGNLNLSQLPEILAAGP
ncbi:MAG TPA: threonine dehydratase [Planctomycetaceae bacterium]|jgi:threonine dehydratase|nr:threonine dehydratase [Planctomycetaceae bacterium]